MTTIPRSRFLNYSDDDSSSAYGDSDHETPQEQTVPTFYFHELMQAPLSIAWNHLTHTDFFDWYTINKHMGDRAHFENLSRYMRGRNAMKQYHKQLTPKNARPYIVVEGPILRRDFIESVVGALIEMKNKNLEMRLPIVPNDIVEQVFQKKINKLPSKSRSKGLSPGVAEYFNVNFACEIDPLLQLEKAPQQSQSTSAAILDDENCDDKDCNDADLPPVVPPKISRRSKPTVNKKAHNAKVAKLKQTDKPKTKPKRKRTAPWTKQQRDAAKRKRNPKSSNKKQKTTKTGPIETIDILDSDDDSCDDSGDDGGFAVFTGHIPEIDNPDQQGATVTHMEIVGQVDTSEQQIEVQFDPVSYLQHSRLSYLCVFFVFFT